MSYAARGTWAYACGNVYDDVLHNDNEIRKNLASGAPTRIEQNARGKRQNNAFPNLASQSVSHLRSCRVVSCRASGIYCGTIANPGTLIEDPRPVDHPSARFAQATDRTIPPRPRLLTGTPPLALDVAAHVRAAARAYKVDRRMSNDLVRVEGPAA